MLVYIWLGLLTICVILLFYTQNTLLDGFLISSDLIMKIVKKLEK